MTSLSLFLLIRVTANSFKLLLPPPRVLLLISLLCKVRRADGATLGVFGCHLRAYGVNYVQMVCAYRQVAPGRKKKETVLVILARFIAVVVRYCSLL